MVFRNFEQLLCFDSCSAVVHALVLYRPPPQKKKNPFTARNRSFRDVFVYTAIGLTSELRLDI